MSGVVEGDEVKAELLFDEAPDRQSLANKDRIALALDQAERLKSIEDEMLERSLQVVGGAVDFAELDPENPQMPTGWVEKYGQEAALRRYRAALAGLANPKEAPVGLKVATQFAVGAIKARATASGGSKTLNIKKVVFPVNAKPVFEEIEVDEDGG